MSTAIRPTPDQIADAMWEDIQPYFDELANRPLDETSVES